MKTTNIIHRLLLGFILSFVSMTSYGQNKTEYVKISTDYYDPSESYDLYTTPYTYEKRAIVFANFSEGQKGEMKIQWGEDGYTHYNDHYPAYFLKRGQYKEISVFNVDAISCFDKYKYIIVSLPGVPDFYSITDVMINGKKLDSEQYIKNYGFVELERYMYETSSDQFFFPEYKTLAIGRWTVAIPTELFREYLNDHFNAYEKGVSINVRFKNKITKGFDVWGFHFQNQVIGPGKIIMRYWDIPDGPYQDYSDINDAFLPKFRIKDRGDLQFLFMSEDPDYELSKDIKVKFSDKDPGISLFEYWKTHQHPEFKFDVPPTEELFWKMVNDSRGLPLGNPDHGLKIIAKFVKKEYTLKIGDVVNGSLKVSTSEGKVAINTDIQIEAIPNDNCELKEILINGKPLSSGIIYKEGKGYKASFTIKENTIISANFISTIHNITKKPSVHGQYSLSEELNVANDTKVIVTTTPDEGYELDKILVNGKAINGTSFIVHDECTVEVLFKKKECKITYNIVGQGRVDVSPNSKMVSYGTEITIKPVPGNGYILDKILVNDKLLIDRIFVVTDDINISASFIPKPKDLLQVNILNPLNGIILARDATTGDYYTGHSEIRLNTLLLLKLNYDHNKYDFGGFTFDGEVFDGYKLRIGHKGELSAILKPKKDFGINNTIQIESIRKGMYSLTSPDSYIGSDLTIINIMGNVVLQQKINSNITTVDLSREPSGIILLRFKDCVKKIKHRRD